MPRFTRRQLSTYVLASQMATDDHDILSALIPFFEPAFVKLRGQIFDPNKFLESLREVGVRFNLTTDIVEHLIPKFVGVGWLVEEASDESEVVFRCLNSAGKETNSLESSAEAIIGNIGIKFKSFVDELDPLTNQNRTQQQLEDILLSWLVSVDGSSNEEIAFVAGSIIEKNDVENRLPKSWNNYIEETDKYLCARFVKHLCDTKDELFSTLSDITGVALLTDVLLDFHYPKRPEDIDVTLILDSPFLLALVGVSGRDRLHNAQMIVRNAKRLECKLAIFEHSIEESEHNLKAVLNLPMAERYGPTGDALRKGEVDLKFVKAMRNDLEGICKSIGITTLRQTLDQFPQQKKFFDDDHVQSFYNRVNWHQEHIPKDRDSSSMALIMRKRLGYRTNDMLTSKFVMVSSNPIFAAFSRRYCKENKLLGELHVARVMHQSQIATIIWLSIGEVESGEVSRRQLLLACENALRSKQEVFDKVRNEIRILKDSEQMEQLELLLARPRSVQTLMDKTLGYEKVLTGENVAAVFQLMRRTVAEEIQREADKKVADVEAVKQQEVIDLKGAISDKEAELTHFQAEFDLRAQQDQDSFRLWVARAMNFEKTMKKIQRWAIISLTTIVFLVGLGLIFFGGDGSYVAGLLIFVALASYIVDLAGVSEHYPYVLSKYVDRKKEQMLVDLAYQSGREDLPRLFDVDWATGNIVQKDRKAEGSK